VGWMGHAERSRLGMRGAGERWYRS
jgi:hypothetical protein